jgi:hypothetical protein
MANKLAPSVTYINESEITPNIITLIKEFEQLGGHVEIGIRTLRFQGYAGICSGYRKFKEMRETSTIDADYAPEFQYIYDQLAWIKGMFEI